MVLQNYQNLIEMTSNIIDIVAFGVGFKCPRKINLNTQCLPGSGITEFDIDCDIWTELPLPSPFICANAIFLV